MDIDLVLEELEREERRERAVAHERIPYEAGPDLLEGIAQLEAAVAALQRVRERPAVALLIWDGQGRLESLEREVGALLAELLARRTEDMPTTSGR